MATETEAGMVEMRVADVWRLPAQGDNPRQSIVVLAEVEGPRRFAIWIGQWEADSLAITIEQMEAPRPPTYVLTSRLLDAAGARLREVHINRLAENTYFAEVVVDGPAGERRVDARPSDALNLAMLAGAPIRVAPDVIEQTLAIGATVETARTAAREGGVAEEDLPTEEGFNHFQKIVSGELTGGAAAIVAEIKAAHQ